MILNPKCHQNAIFPFLIDSCWTNNRVIQKEIISELKKLEETFWMHINCQLVLERVWMNKNKCLRHQIPSYSELDRFICWICSSEWKYSKSERRASDLKSKCQLYLMNSFYGTYNRFTRSSWKQFGRFSLKSWKNMLTFNEI